MNTQHGNSLVEAPPVDSNDDPRIGEQDIRLLKGLDVFISL